MANQTDTSPLDREELTIHGHRFVVRRGGSGPTLVLLHGMAGDSLTWAAAAHELKERFTIIAPDLLGHGESSTQATDYSLGAHATVVRDIMRMLDCEHATVAGQSFGGGVALQFAYQFPEMCERLVLVSSGGLGREVATLLRALSLPGASYVLGAFSSSMFTSAGRTLAAKLEPCGIRVSAEVGEIWKSYLSLADPARREAFLQTLRAVIDHRGQSVSAADRLYLTERMPSMIVWGGHDPIIPIKHAYEAAEAIPNSRLEIFENAGHFPHCESPRRFARLIGDFVDSTQAADLTDLDWRTVIRGS